MDDFYSTTRGQLETWLQGQGMAPVHARAVFRQAYRDLNASPWTEASLPRRLQRLGPQSFELGCPSIAQQSLSGYDHAVKFVLKLADGELIESVLMPEKTRITLCLSSQVGCRQACSFCHTGRMGLRRNLTAGEIVGQLVLANRWIADHPQWLRQVRLPAGTRVSNGVFMGMGEPLDNVQEVVKALTILTDPFGLGMAARRLTVSTAGHLDGMRELVNSGLGVGLALSLHSTDPAERSRLMPINRRYPLAEVLDFFRTYTAISGRDVLIQYTVIAGVNDGPEQAERLATLLSGIRAKVNLIPLNPIAVSRFNAPEPDSVQRLHQLLLAAGLRSMVRYSKGQDIAAACGQLVTQQKACVS